jgi:hypothetical protein
MIDEVQSQDLVISKQLGMDITRYKNIYPHVAAAIQGSVSISLQGSDPDKEDKVTFVIVSGPSHATIAGFDKLAGILTYIPNPGFTGHDNLKFKVIDSNGAESNDASVSISISVTGERSQTQSQPQAQNGATETVIVQNETTTQIEIPSKQQQALKGNEPAAVSSSSSPSFSRSNLIMPHYVILFNFVEQGIYL